MTAHQRSRRTLKTDSAKLDGKEEEEEEGQEAPAGPWAIVVRSCCHTWRAKVCQEGKIDSCLSSWCCDDPYSLWRARGPTRHSVLRISRRRKNVSGLHIEEQPEQLSFHDDRHARRYCS